MIGIICLAFFQIILSFVIDIFVKKKSFDDYWKFWNGLDRPKKSKIDEINKKRKTKRQKTNNKSKTRDRKNTKTQLKIK